MDLKSAKKILNEMLDLSAQIEDQILSEEAEGIYRDVQAAKTIEHVIAAGRELIIFINEVPGDDEIKAEIEELYTSLLESHDEL